MNQKTAIALSVASGIGLAGVVVTAGKLVIKKKPELKEKVETGLIWTSGLFIGAGIGILVSPKIISKSQAASILASD